MQELPSRQATPNQRWPNVGSPSTTLGQRHTKLDSTCRVRRATHNYENIESRSPGKTQTTTQSGFTAGPPFRTPTQQQNNIGPLPASPGQCRHQQAKTLSQSRYNVDPSSSTLAQHCSNTGRTLCLHGAYKCCYTLKVK